MRMHCFSRVNGERNRGWASLGHRLGIVWALFRIAGRFPGVVLHLRPFIIGGPWDPHWALIIGGSQVAHGSVGQL